MKSIENEFELNHNSNLNTVEGEWGKKTKLILSRTKYLENTSNMEGGKHGVESRVKQKQYIKIKGTQKHEKWK